MIVLRLWLALGRLLGLFFEALRAGRLSPDVRNTASDA
jgi:hypothetical protein